MRSTKLIRAAKIAYIITSLLFCVGGALLLTLGDLSVSVIGTAGGILAGYFSKDLYRLAFQFDLAEGILLLVIGAAVLCNPDRAIAFLCLMLGLAVLVDALCKLQTALDARLFGLPAWGLILGLAICTGLIGAVLAFRPAASARVLTALLGVSLVAEGALNLCVALFAVKVIRHQRPEEAEYWIEDEK